MPPSTLKIDDTPKVTVISRDYGYVKIGWSVKMKNQSNQPAPEGWLKIKWLDKKGVQVERGLLKVESIGPWKTYNATDTDSIKEETYNLIDSVVVEFDAN